MNDDELLKKLLLGRNWPIVHDPAPADLPPADAIQSLSDIMQRNLTKSPALAAKQARLLEILQTRRRT